MLPLLKKKEPKSENGPPGVSWHPDFRNKATLPDTKTVRTKFFVHIVVIAVTVGLALYVGFREFNIATLRSELAAIESQIEANTKLSNAAVTNYTKFQAEETRYQEAYALIKAPFRFPDFLVVLGELLPPGARINQVDYRGAGKIILVTGTVRGLDAAAGDRAAELVRKLQEEVRFKEHFSSVVLTNLGRDAAKGNLDLEIVFTFKPAPKSTNGK
jgi:hypothetical protein